MDGILAIVLIVLTAIAAYATGKMQPNGDAIMWRLKLKKGCQYDVRPLQPWPGDPDEYLVVRDRGGFYKPFLIILPPKQTYVVEKDDQISLNWEKGKPALKVQKPSLVSQGGPL